MNASPATKWTPCLSGSAQPALAHTASNVSALSAGDSVAVGFDVGRVGLQYFRGTVVRVMNARVRVKFPDVDGSCITRDVDKDKLFDIDETS